MAINVIMTHFRTPFSFFCVENNTNEGEIENKIKKYISKTYGTVLKNYSSELHDGDYIALKYNHKWTRAIISFKNKVDTTLWLIDHGVELRVDDDIFCLPLPPEFKMMPSKVFEASLHAIAPVAKDINLDYSKLIDVPCLQWTVATYTFCKKKLSEAVSLKFESIFKFKHLVLGELLLVFENKTETLRNLLFENGLGALDKKYYLENLEIFYIKGPMHYLQIETPIFVVNLHNLTESDLKNYKNFPPDIKSQSELSMLSWTSSSELTKVNVNKCFKHNHIDKLEIRSNLKIGDGKNLVFDANIFRKKDIQKYANKYITIGDIKYNFLYLLSNKIADYKMASMCKDFDEVSLGRGYSRKII